MQIIFQLSDTLQISYVPLNLICKHLNVLNLCIYILGYPVYFHESQGCAAIGCLLCLQVYKIHDRMRWDNSTEGNINSDTIWREVLSTFWFSQVSLRPLSVPAMEPIISSGKQRHGQRLKNTVESTSLICHQPTTRGKLTASNIFHMTDVAGSVSTKMPMKRGGGQEGEMHRSSNGQIHTQMKKAGVWQVHNMAFTKKTVTGNTFSSVSKAAWFWCRKKRRGSRRWGIVAESTLTWSVWKWSELWLKPCRRAGKPRQTTCGLACASWLISGCGWTGMRWATKPGAKGRRHSAPAGVTAVGPSHWRESTGSAGTVQTDSTLSATKALECILTCMIHVHVVPDRLYQSRWDFFPG